MTLQWLFHAGSDDSRCLTITDPCVRSLIGIKHIPVKTAVPALSNVLYKYQILEKRPTCFDFWQPEPIKMRDFFSLCGHSVSLAPVVIVSPGVKEFPMNTTS